MVKESTYDCITFSKYKDTTKRLLKYSFPHMAESDFDAAIDYSIKKRYEEHPASIFNNYTNKRLDTTLLDITNYIYTREPILTGYGVMFKKHGVVPNPVTKVIQQFLDNRSIHKGIMFRYEKGSEDYERWNLVQQLDKIDANGIFGILTMNASLIYNIHVGASILAQARSQISAAAMQFEMFLSNSVQFGSLDEVVVYIDNIVREKSTRQYQDKFIIKEDVPLHQVFGHLIMMCGWYWIPDEEEMEIIWNMLQNMSQWDLNRIYYKNNLYEFMNASDYMRGLLKTILEKLKTPYMEPMKPPKEIKAELDEFRDIMLEYVYYSYPIPDKVDRMKNMVKSIIMISDTDSAIISLDAWFRYSLELVKGEHLQMFNKKIDVFREVEFDEFGDIKDTSWRECVDFVEQDITFDFYDDDLVELEHKIDPTVFLPQDGLRYSIINIMCYILDWISNDYMLKFTKCHHSWAPDKDCKIILKNEFLFKRALLTTGQKNYASYQEIQEGHKIPPEEALDIKGIQALIKAGTPAPTKKALKKILYEDILTADNIDQVKIIKHLAAVERNIVNSIASGSKEYYKPVNVKSTHSYDDPMGIQGIKASVAWNALKRDDQEPINLDQRNHIDIAKVQLNKKTLNRLEQFPEVYDKAVKLLEDPAFKKNGECTSIAIPPSEDVPDWLIAIIDTNTIVTDNISGFPVESVGIQRLDKNVNLSTMIKL